MALRFCLLALSVIFAASSGVLASDSQQCRSMLIGYPGWTTNVTQNDLSMMSMLSQVAMDQTYPASSGGAYGTDWTYGPKILHVLRKELGTFSLGCLRGLRRWNENMYDMPDSHNRREAKSIL